jgi:hypothetical protein
VPSRYITGKAMNEALVWFPYTTQPRQSPREAAHFCARPAIWCLSTALGWTVQLQLERLSHSGHGQVGPTGLRLQDVSRTTVQNNNKSVARSAASRNMRRSTYFYQKFRRSLRVALLRRVVYIRNTKACPISIRPLEVIQ